MALGAGENSVRNVVLRQGMVLAISGIAVGLASSFRLAPDRVVVFSGMSAFLVSVVARNPKNEEQATPPVQALVDTGSELTWIPADLLHRAGIVPRRKRSFATATQKLVERDVGYAIVAAEGFETSDEVVFAEPSDTVLLGVRTIEGFGVIVDNIDHRFVARTTIVAATAP